MRLCLSSRVKSTLSAVAPRAVRSGPAILAGRCISGPAGRDNAGVGLDSEKRPGTWTTGTAHGVRLPVESTAFLAFLLWTASASAIAPVGIYVGTSTYPDTA